MFLFVFVVFLCMLHMWLPFGVINNNNNNNNNKGRDTRAAAWQSMTSTGPGPNHS